MLMNPIPTPPDIVWNSTLKVNMYNQYLLVPDAYNKYWTPACNSTCIVNQNWYLQECNMLWFDTLTPPTFCDLNHPNLVKMQYKIGGQNSFSIAANETSFWRTFSVDEKLQSSWGMNVRACMNCTANGGTPTLSSLFNYIQTDDCQALANEHFSSRVTHQIAQFAGEANLFTRNYSVFQYCGQELLKCKINNCTVSENPQKILVSQVGMSFTVDTSLEQNSTLTLECSMWHGPTKIQINQTFPISITNQIDCTKTLFTRDTSAFRITSYPIQDWIVNPNASTTDYVIYNEATSSQSESGELFNVLDPTNCGLLPQNATLLDVNNNTLPLDYTVSGTTGNLTITLNNIDYTKRYNDVYKIRFDMRNDFNPPSFVSTFDSKFLGLLICDDQLEAQYLSYPMTNMFPAFTVIEQKGQTIYRASIPDCFSDPINNISHDRYCRYCRTNNLTMYDVDANGAPTTVRPHSNWTFEINNLQLRGYLTIPQWPDTPFFIGVQRFAVLFTYHGGFSYWLKNDQGGRDFTLNVTCGVYTDQGAGPLLWNYLNSTPVHWVDSNMQDTRINHTQAMLAWETMCLLDKVTLTPLISAMHIDWGPSYDPTVSGYNTSFAVVPDDISLDQRISYNITYHLKHSLQTLNFTYNAEIGCNGLHVQTTYQPASPVNKVIYVSNLTKEIDITIPWPTINLNYCPQTSIQLKNVTINTTLQQTPETVVFNDLNNSCTTEPCIFKVNVTVPGNIRFAFTNTARNVVVFDQPWIHKVNVQCDNRMNSTITQADPVMEFWHKDPNGSTLDFSDYPCIALQCCLNVVYQATSTGPPLPNPPTPHPYQQQLQINSIGPDQRQLQVNTSIDPGDYQFYIYGSNGFQDQAWSPLINLKVKCGSSITVDDTQFPYGLGVTQEVMTLAYDTYFVLPNYTTNYPDYCYVDYHKLRFDDTLFRLENNTDGAWVLRPLQNDVHAIYHFNVTAVVRYDNVTLPSSPYTLMVGCTSSLQWVVDQDFVFNLEINPGNPENREYEVKFPNIISKDRCPVFDYHIKNQTLNGLPSQRLVEKQANCSDEWFRCKFIKPLFSGKLSRIEFDLEFMTLGDQKYSIRAMITVGDCLKNSTTITSMMTEQKVKIIQQRNTSGSQLSFAGFNCSNMHCCSLKLSQTKQLDGEPPFTKASVAPMSYQNNIVMLNAPIDRVQTQTFRITATNGYGIYGVSKLITISVTPQSVTDPLILQWILDMLLARNKESESNNSTTIPGNLKASEDNSTYKYFVPGEGVRFEEHFEEMMKGFLDKNIYRSYSGFQTNPNILSGRLKDFEKLLKSYNRTTPPLDFEWTNKFENNQTQEFFSSRIKEVNRNGEVIIEFNEDLQSDMVSIDKIDQEILNLTLILSQTTLQLSSIPEEKLRNFTWKTEKFGSTELTLSLEFAHPLQLAQGKGKDLLQVVVLDDTYFKTKNGRRKLDRKSFVMQKMIVKQLANDMPSLVLKNSLNVMKGTMDASAIATITLNLFLSLGLNRLLGMINALHIIAYQMMCNLDFPANVSYFMGIVIHLLNADILDPDWTTAYLFHFNNDINYVEFALEQQHEMFLHRSYIDTGFETYNPILNLGGLFILFILSFVELLIVGILFILARISQYLFNVVKPIEPREGGDDSESSDKPITLDRKKILKKKCKRFLNDQFYRVNFNQSIVIINESFIPLLVSAILFLKVPWDLEVMHLMENPIEYNNNWILSCVLLMITGLIMPIITLIVFFWDVRHLTDTNDQFYKMFRSLFEDINVKSKVNRIFPFMYVLRRCLLVICVMFTGEFRGIQVMTIIYLNMLFFCLAGNMQPYKIKRENRFMMYNETIIYHLTLFMVLFTDFCPSFINKYFLGWGFVGELCVFLAINLYNILSPSLRQFYLRLKLLYIKGKACWRYYFKEEIEEEKRISFGKWASKKIEERYGIKPKSRLRTKRTQIKIITKRDQDVPAQEPAIQATEENQKLPADVFLNILPDQEETQLEQIRQTVELGESQLYQTVRKVFNFVVIRQINVVREQFLDCIEKDEEDEAWDHLRQSELMEEDKCRFVLNFYASKIYKTLYLEKTPNFSLMTDEQRKESFRTFYEGCVYELKVKRWRKLSAQQKQSLRDWSTLWTQMIEGRSASRPDFYWYILDIHPEWFINISYDKQIVEQIASSHIKIQVAELKETLDEASKQKLIDLNFSLKQVSILSQTRSAQRHNRIINHVTSKLRRQELKLDEATQLIEMFYSILNNKGLAVLNYFRENRIPQSYSFLKHIWNEVRLLSAEKLLEDE